MTNDTGKTRHAGRSAVAAAVTGLALLTGTSMAAAAPAAAGGWGKATELPGIAALNVGEVVHADVISCASPGNCAAGGDFYTSEANSSEAFVASQVNGTWGKAIEVPGLASLNQGGVARVTAVSCAAAGNCTAGGYYDPGPALETRPFVVTETGGTWGTAEEVPGIAALALGTIAQVQAVSCASAGNCGVSGYYTDGSRHSEAFVVTETGGVWGTAEEIPGTAALNTGGAARAGAISCPAAGDCVAGGAYRTSADAVEPYVVTETGGVWGTAEEVPGAATGTAAGVAAMSCPAAGSCTAGGSIVTSPGNEQAFVVTETGGTWGTARRLGVNLSAVVEIDALSCGSVGNCAAGGSYSNLDADERYAFVVTERNGVWGGGREVVGTLNSDANAAVDTVSCGAAGDCVAGGSYLRTAHTVEHAAQEAFVVSETGGSWGQGEEVPGIAALNGDGYAETSAVSCATAGHCGATGFYEGSGSTGFSIFVATSS